MITTGVLSLLQDIMPKEYGDGSCRAAPSYAKKCM